MVFFGVGFTPLSGGEVCLGPVLLAVLGVPTLLVRGVARLAPAVAMFEHRRGGCFGDGQFDAAIFARGHDLYLSRTNCRGLTDAAWPGMIGLRGGLLLRGVGRHGFLRGCVSPRLWSVYGSEHAEIGSHRVLAASQSDATEDDGLDRRVPRGVLDPHARDPVPAMRRFDVPGKAKGPTKAQQELAAKEHAKRQEIDRLVDGVAPISGKPRPRKIRVRKLLDIETRYCKRNPDRAK